MSSLRAASVAVILFAASSCGRVRSPADPDSTKPAVEWAAPLLGGPPEATAVVAPAVARGEIDLAGVAPFGVLQLASPASWAFSHCQQVDYYIGPRTASSTIIVLHGVPAWLDPTRPYPEIDRPGVAPVTWYALRRTTQSGTRVYAYQAQREDVRLFVVAPDTWIVADGAAAQRIDAESSAKAVRPPTALITSGSIEDSWALTKTGTHFFPAVRLDWIRGFDQVTELGFSRFPAVAGMVPMTFRLVFPSVAEASAAASDVSRLSANGSVASLWGSAEDRIVDVQRSDATLVLRTVLRW